MPRTKRKPPAKLSPRPKATQSDPKPRAKVERYESLPPLAEDPEPATAADLDQVRTVVDRIVFSLEELGRSLQRPVARAASAPNPAVGSDGRPNAPATGDEEALYQRLKARLLAELPELLRVILTKPEILVKVERQVLDVAGDTLRGRIALLIREGFFDDSGVTGTAVNKELEKITSKQLPVGTLYGELDELVRLGFLRVEPAKDKKTGKRYQSVESMKSNVKEKS